MEHRFPSPGRLAREARSRRDRAWRAASLVAIAAALVAPRALAQTTMDNPVEEVRPFALDSGPVAHPGAAPVVVFAATVRIEDAAWLRLHFSALGLPAGTVLRLTSALDGEQQVLDADAARLWRRTSAYFNGGTVHVELVAGPGTHDNRVVLDHVTTQRGVPAAVGSCGICDADDRLPSDADWAGRLQPGGCSASIWSEGSEAVTAGHCVDANTIMQFRVPPSNDDCSLAHPPVSDQFPIVRAYYRNAGIGADWGVLRLGPNDRGELPYERYGQLRPISSAVAAVGETGAVWGYGIDDECERYAVQQHSTGQFTAVDTTAYRHDIDTTFGNSGSGVLVDDRIVGIATHCGCPFNSATRVDAPDFAAARDLLAFPRCPDAPDVDCDGNGERDGCEVVDTVMETSPVLSPIGDGFPQRHVFDPLPPAAGPVRIRVEASGNFRNGLQTLDVILNGEPVGVLFDTQSAADHCSEPGDLGAVWMSAEAFAAIVGDGPAVVDLVASSWVDPFHCDGSSWVVVDIATTTPSAVDCNRNGAPDACDITSGRSHDWDGSGTPDECDCLADLDADAAIGFGDLGLLLLAWGACDGCPADLDRDGDVGAADLEFLLETWGGCEGG